MIYNKENIKKYRQSLGRGIKSSQQVGQQFLFLMNEL